MKKFLVLIGLCLFLSGCTKTGDMNGSKIATPNNIPIVDVSAYDESHTTDENDYLGDYIRYVETEYKEAVTDYAMFKVGGYPLYAKSYDAGESISRYSGNGYEYTIKNNDEPVYYWKWTDDEVHEEVMAAIEKGKGIYNQLKQTEEALLEQHKDDAYEEDWFRNGVRTVKAELEYFPSGEETSWKVDLSKEQIEKIKDILQRTKINPEVDPYQSDFRYTLSLYDSLGDYIFVVVMDSDKTTMYVEGGGCESLELKDMLNNIIQTMEESINTITD